MVPAQAASRRLWLSSLGLLVASIWWASDQSICSDDEQVLGECQVVHDGPPLVTHETVVAAPDCKLMSPYLTLRPDLPPGVPYYSIPLQDNQSAQFELVGREASIQSYLLVVGSLDQSGAAHRVDWQAEALPLAAQPSAGCQATVAAFLPTASQTSAVAKPSVASDLATTDAWLWRVRARREIMQRQRLQQREWEAAAARTTRLGVGSMDYPRAGFLQVAPSAFAFAPIAVSAPWTQSHEAVAQFPDSLMATEPTPFWDAVRRSSELQIVGTEKIGSTDAADSHLESEFDSRLFYLAVRDGDLRDAQTYQAVPAVRTATGRYCQVYVDQTDWPDMISPEQCTALCQLFDTVVLPRTQEQIGRHWDTDGDGRFTLFLTHYLGQLGDGKYAVGGFVRGSDLAPEVPPPFGNACDMMYLNVALPPTEQQLSLLVHEYTHAIIFSEHHFGRYLPQRPATQREEEDWLNEAIAHILEIQIGQSWRNLDFRISTFLNAPEYYRLVVPDYHRAGLWRCHGSRGATYLFLQWCVEQFGPSSLRELVQSNLQGIDNLETATQTRFADLFRDWSVHLSVGHHHTQSAETTATELTACDAAPSSSATICLPEDCRGLLAERLLAGPRWRPAPVGEYAWHLLGTSFFPVVAHVPANQRLRCQLQSEATSALQVSVIPLPADWPIVELSVQPVTATAPASGLYQLTLHHRAGADVQWHWCAWEQTRLPQSNATTADRETLLMPASALFTHSSTQADTTRESAPIALPGFAPSNGTLKLLGSDPSGRPISVFVELCVP